VIREPAQNAVIDLHVEYDKSMNSDGVTSRFARTQARYYPHIEQLVDLIERARVAAQADRQLTTSR
jgi:hypothetical protein